MCICAGHRDYAQSYNGAGTGFGGYFWEHKGLPYYRLFYKVYSASCNPCASQDIQKYLTWPESNSKCALGFSAVWEVWRRQSAMVFREPSYPTCKSAPCPFLMLFTYWRLYMMWALNNWKYSAINPSYTAEKLDWGRIYMAGIWLQYPHSAGFNLAEPQGSGCLSHYTDTIISPLYGHVKPVQYTR